MTDNAPKTIIPFPNGRAPENNGIAVREEGNVKLFGGATTMSHHPDRLLAMAEGKLCKVVILGWEKDGGFYMAASESAVSESLLLLRRGQLLMDTYLRD